MGVTALLVGLLLGGGFGAPLTLQRVSPSLEPAQPHVRVGYSDRIAVTPWARHGDLIAVRRHSSVLVLSAATLRPIRAIAVPPTLDCAFGFDDATIVLVTGCSSGHARRRLVLRVDPVQGTVSRVAATFRLDGPFDAAFGDGNVYFAGPTRTQVIDERTGRVATHATRRSLAKGGGFVTATWLGDHLLALNATIRDARNWRLWAVLRGGNRVAAGPSDLVAYGSRGVSVYTRDARFRYRVLRGENVNDVTIVGRTMFARVGDSYDVVDLGAGRRQAIRLAYFSGLLAP